MDDKMNRFRIFNENNKLFIHRHNNFMTHIHGDISFYYSTISL